MPINEADTCRLYALPKLQVSDWENYQRFLSNSISRAYCFHFLLGIRAKIVRESIGNYVRCLHFNPSDFRAYDFLLLPMVHQQKIVAATAKVEHIKASLHAAEEEFPALIPALLNRTFE